ncbi:MAG: aminoacetone oxidase family FAD-binding enzyme [Campylobacterales bacterium]|nr:aminoacetone oxidase family FAD-binding enzyme [Campylobacterales bacterium]
MIPVVIIGGGASGLMLASLLPKKSAIVIESNPKVGAKLLVSGGGRCNVTNEVVSSDNYLGDKDFISSVLRQFDQNALLNWCDARGLGLISQKNHQYFCPNSAKEIVSILTKESSKQTVLLNEKVVSILSDKDGFLVQTNKQQIKSKSVVVASGGLSYPVLGASDIGYKLAQNVGHRISKLAPALVGFTLQKEQFFMKELSGSSVGNVEIKVGINSCKGDLLFAHKGISGPSVLNASLYWEKGSISIDFLPNFRWKSLSGSKKNISTLLPLPKRVMKALLEHLSIPDKPFVALSKEERDRLYELHNYTLAPAGTFGYSKAEVTKGGVSIDEIDVSSMMSKKIDSLYFIGEVLDVTGELGGYNLQWAFSSAFVCAKALNKYL